MRVIYINRMHFKAILLHEYVLLSTISRNVKHTLGNSALFLC